MRVLVVGGSGYVGRLVLPFLTDRFALRVFDRVPPATGGVEYAAGDVTHPHELVSAARGMDVLLYMAMGTSGGEASKGETPGPAYDVNLKGLHLALEAAVAAGMSRAVQISTLSVYSRYPLRGEPPLTEEEPPSPCSIYGLTKLLAEELCRHFSRMHAFPILSLRIYKPLAREQWLAEYDTTKVEPRLSAPDLARAIAASLEFRHAGFDVLQISGDFRGLAYPFDKARRLLGWEPLERPLGPAGNASH
jgi:nucleoside-diphosphate-sugar epimerase